MNLIADLDRYQRRHRWLGIPVAVANKFIDDQGGYLAALIAYYGFLSLFPLLLIATTVLGYVLHGHPELVQELLGSALAQFPVIGDQLRDSAHPLHGSTAGLISGVLVALYGGLGFTVALQNAFNQIWAVPVNDRPSALSARLRGLALLTILALWLLLTTALTALSSATATAITHLGLALPTIAVSIPAVMISAAVNWAVFVFSFRVLTSRELRTRDVAAGAAGAALAWQALQSFGAQLVSHELRGSTATYGTFGLVLGLLAWIYLQAVVITVAAELNVVRAEHLWPRALQRTDNPDDAARLTGADRRSYRAYAQAQRFTDLEHIQVEFPTTGPE